MESIYRPTVSWCPKEGSSFISAAKRLETQHEYWSGRRKASCHPRGKPSHPPGHLEPALWDRPSGGPRKSTSFLPRDPIDPAAHLFSRLIVLHLPISFLSDQPSHLPTSRSLCIVLLQATSLSVQSGRTGTLPEDAPPTLLRGYTEEAPTYRATPSVSHA